MDNLPSKYTDQVIQAVTFFSPLFGGHQQPFKGSRFHSPSQRGEPELPGMVYLCVCIPTFETLISRVE